MTYNNSAYSQLVLTRLCSPGQSDKPTTLPTLAHQAVAAPRSSARQSHQPEEPQSTELLLARFQHGHNWKYLPSSQVRIHTGSLCSLRKPAVLQLTLIIQ